MKYKVEFGIYEFRKSRKIEFRDFSKLEVIPIGTNELECEYECYDSKKKDYVHGIRKLKILRSYKFNDMCEWVAVRRKPRKKGAVMYMVHGNDFKVRRR